MFETQSNLLLINKTYMHGLQILSNFDQDIVSSSKEIVTSEFCKVVLITCFQSKHQLSVYYSEN